MMLEPVSHSDVVAVSIELACGRAAPGGVTRFGKLHALMTRLRIQNGPHSLRRMSPIVPGNPMDNKFHWIHRFAANITNRAYGVSRGATAAGSNERTTFVGSVLAARSFYGNTSIDSSVKRQPAGYSSPPRSLHVIYRCCGSASAHQPSIKSLNLPIFGVRSQSSCLDSSCGASSPRLCNTCSAASPYSWVYGLEAVGP
jgi:hypothetical protein